MQFPRIAETLPGSQILAVSNAIKERVRGGEKIYDFTVGDFDPVIFPIPAALEAGVIESYHAGQTNYPDAQGNLDLRESIAAFTLSVQGVHFSPGEILCGSGDRPLIYTLYRSLVDPGDTVIYPVPGWNNHYYAKLVGARAVEIETTAADHFMPTADAIVPYLGGAVLLALCSPQNPTGTCFTREGLAAICALVLAENNKRGPGEKKLYVLYDQMYGLLTYGNNQHTDPVALCPAWGEF